MALPFLRALHPGSEYSGIQYCLAEGRSCQGKEMLDLPLLYSLSRALYQRLNLLDGLVATFSIVYGSHYDLNLSVENSRCEVYAGRKGLLDYLYFPLVGRKLVADSFLEENRNNYKKRVPMFAIGVILEMMRLIAAFVLTCLIAPLVVVVHAGRFASNLISLTADLCELGSSLKR